VRLPPTACRSAR